MQHARENLTVRSFIRTSIIYFGLTIIALKTLPEGWLVPKVERNDARKNERDQTQIQQSATGAWDAAKREQSHTDKAKQDDQGR